MKWLDHRKGFIVAFVGTIAVVVGLISGVLTLLGTHFTARVTFVSLAAACMVTMVLHWGRLRPDQVPPDIIPERMSSERKKVCCPCSLALSQEVAILARSCFGSDTIALDRYEQLRVKNPNILACLLNENGAFAGYFDIMPLDEAFGMLFMSGKLGEKDLTHENVVVPEKMSSARFVYLSGIASVDASTVAGMQNASILVWTSLKYLEHFYGGSTAVAFASAVTNEGERLLQRLGFTLHSEAKGRSDRHSLYCIQLSASIIRNWLRAMPDYSALIELPWNCPQIVPIPFSGARRAVLPRFEDRWAQTGTEGPLRRVK